MGDPKKLYKTKDQDKTYRAWLLGRLLTVLVIAALLLAGARVIGATGQEWIRKYDLIGLYVLKSYEAEAGEESPE